MLRRSVWLFGLLSFLPVAFACYEYGRTEGDDLELARQEQCGIEYRVLIRQIIEHADQLTGQANSLFLAQLGQLEARPCVDSTLREAPFPTGSVERLRPIAQAATSELGRAAYLQALFSLFTEVGKRTHLDADSSPDGQYAWNISQNLFVVAIPSLTRLDPVAPGGDVTIRHLLEAVPIGAASPLANKTMPDRERYRSALRNAMSLTSGGASAIAELANARVHLGSLFDAVAVGQHEALRQRIEEDSVERRILFAAAALVIILVVLAGALGTLRIVQQNRDRRIETLVRISRRTARGELGLAVDTQGKGKVAELEVAFNQMSAELRSGHQKVVHELEVARATAEGSQRYLRNLTDSVPGALFEFITIPGGQVSLPFANLGYRELLGSGSLQGMRDMEASLQRVVPEDLPGLLSVLHASDSISADVRHEFRVREPESGEIRWLHLHASSPRRLYSGAVRRFGLISDITAQKQLESSLARALDQAREAERFKSEFMRNVSHEIRTPMISITGMTYLVQQTQLDARQRELVDHISAAAKRLTLVINDLLDFSRLDAGDVTLEVSEFGVATLVEAVGAGLKSRARAKGLDFGLSVGSGVPGRLVGDMAKLQRILEQFVDNAIKFTQHGRVDLEIGVQNSTSSTVGLRFVVRDTGPGMDAAVVRRLFSTVAQADGSAARRHGGTGIGLVLSKQLADLMHAELSVESTPGTGTMARMTVSLSRAQSPGPDYGIPPEDAGSHQVVERSPIDKPVPAGFHMEPGVFETLASQIRGYDSEAAETLDRLIGKLGSSPPRVLAAMREHLRNFAFEDALVLLDSLRKPEWPVQSATSGS